MKYLAILLMILLLGACKANGPGNADYFAGPISAQQLLSQYPVFQQAYDDYHPSPQELAAVHRLAGHSLTILFGTWCHDSEREVPRLLKLLEISQVALKDIKLVAVDLHKSDPDGLSRQHNLRYTPTFILSVDEQEIGRVVERPVNSLGEDLAAFIH